MAETPTGPRKDPGQGPSEGPDSGNGSESAEAGTGKTPAPDRPRRRLWLAMAVFVLTILLLVLHRCDREPPPVNPPLLPPKGMGALDTPPPPPPPDTPAADTPALPKVKAPPPARTAQKLPDPPPDTPAARIMAPDSALPYIYADPWGGRHFDSVRVALHCREGCLVLYSLEDSVHFKSYQDTLVFRRDATLWISGLDSAGRQVPPARIEYVIERDPGACRESNMPVTYAGRTVCMDVYEWPNREGGIPRAHVSWQDAADSCASQGKRLCTVEEWRAACAGPDGAGYPYGATYNEKHCPAKEPSSSRSGRHPACRSYFGQYDMTGNLWEWTSTPGGADGDFFLVAGGNWNGGNEATCGQAKFSFYPSVRYPFVGFRCCRDPK